MELGEDIFEKAVKDAIKYIESGYEERSEVVQKIMWRWNVTMWEAENIVDKAESESNHLLAR